MVYAPGVLGIVLPEWFSPDNLRTIAIVVVVAMAIAWFLVMRFVQKLIMKAVFTVVLAVIAFGVWNERANLGDCAKTCDCKVLGFEVHIPQAQLPLNRCPAGTA